ncbi:hypothetical protein Belba_2002 [Belliella baltica DSM 15883]|uniref:Outer membrane protein beta-barrel domain-containing protein n=1 Tax=Belliella baltica (strain DSM 15883 / CIP 108006 / LMG 21964 / BA134) TaxID=866536 RepID=I3Z5Q8_BELBD|nr:hypothetical protein Belba_2002 [Belliella baltica DSM 15883]
MRGGFTSGVSLKHFISSRGALEFVVGSRWHGVSISGMYQMHQSGALGVPELSWVYGLGARVGHYDRYYYYYGYRGPGNCQDPNNPRCYPYYNRYRTGGFTAVGLLGIGGLEYKFKDIPFTLGIDLIPYFYFNHWGGSFIDGSISVRYILK